MAWSGPIREDSALRGPDRPGAATLSVISIALLVTLACLYLTFSKSAWLATGVALCLLALACLHGWRSRLVAVFLAVVASAVVAPWPLVVLRPMAPPVAGGYEALMTRIWGADRLASWDPTTAGGEVSITERLYASGAALQMAADHPLLGVGLDRFKSEYAGAYRDPRAKVVLDSAHDLLPNLAAESGLPFALLVAAAMAAGLAAAWRVWGATDDGELRLLAAGLGTALVAWWIVSATFDPDLYRIWRLMASDIVFAAVLVGLALALPGLADARSVPPSPLRRGDLPLDGRPDRMAPEDPVLAKHVAHGALSGSD
jgi:O-antigen ligase